MKIQSIKSLIVLLISFAPTAINAMNRENTRPQNPLQLRLRTFTQTIEKHISQQRPLSLKKVLDLLDGHLQLVNYGYDIEKTNNGETNVTVFVNNQRLNFTPIWQMIQKLQSNKNVQMNNQNE